VTSWNGPLSGAHAEPARRGGKGVLRQTKALMPVIDLPTMRVFISRVPS
jgi:hypothetical protein